MSEFRFKLRHLITDNLAWWLVAWALGIMTVVSVLGLLMVAGWFVTVSGMIGVMGLAVNYALASTMIRTFALSRTAGRYGELVVAHHIIFELLKNLRVRFFESFAKLSPSTQRSIGSSDSQYRLVKDIDVLNEFVLKFISPIIMSVVGLTLVLTVIAYWQGAWAWVFLLVVAGLFIFSVIVGAKLAQEELGVLQARKSNLQHILPAITQLLIWNQWRAQTLEFNKLDSQVVDFYHRHQKLRQLVMIALSWLMTGLFVLVLYIGIDGLSGSGDVMAVAYLLAMLFGVVGLSEVLMNLVNEPLSYGRSRCAKNRLNELVGQSDALSTVPLGNEILQLHLNNLVTKQPNAVIELPAVNMTVTQGVPMLIQGVSGGGKSTLLDTIACEIMPVRGELSLLVNDVKHLLSQIDWQGKLGYLGQKVDIFDQTLANNLRLGKIDASDDELWQVLDIVGLKEWAMNEPQGLSTPLGEYGAAVSGGQARRIALARLLLTPKRLLLLDEPFAGLDEHTCHKLWQNLKTHQQNGLLIIVTHDRWLGKEQNVDRVVVGAI